MGDSIFYTSVKRPIQKKIRSRGAAYGTTERTTNTLRWLAGRSVYASASAVHTRTGRSASIGTPSGGGFGNNGLYSKGGKDSDGDVKLLPKPNITNIKIFDSAPWGSVKQCELSFTCYNRAQLNSLQAFFDIGADLTLKYGWSQSVGAYGDSGVFEGKTFNFNYTVNPSGGWDCTVKGMAKGIDAASSSAKGTPEKPIPAIADPLGAELPLFSIVARIKGSINKLSTSISHQQIQQDNLFNIGCIEFATSWGAAAESSESESVEASADKKEDKKHYYVSLESIVAWAQAILRAAQGGAATTRILCDNTITLSPNVSNTKHLISANPKEIIFSGFNKYGNNHDLNFTGLTIDMGDAIDSSNIMISVDFLESIFPELDKPGGGQTKADSSISAFLSKIFDSIHANSGNRFSLSLTQNPDKEDGSEWWVVDAFYKGNSAVEIMEFQAFNKNSVVRSISIDSRVPDEMASAAFVAPGAASGYPAGTKYSETVLEIAKTPLNFDEELEKLKKIFDSTEVNKPPADGSEAVEVGPTSNNITDLQHLLRAIYVTDPASNKDSFPVYPLGFSVTIDGIEGIVFGNTVSTNYLPQTYYDKVGTSKVVFTVTKVSHDITPQDWTTTIETVCRLPA
jgi:hypothetical protein